MLDVSRLTRRYGSLVAVDQVSFSILQGQIVGLLGHNGAGKTTIMKMVSGYLEPDAGTVTIGGLDLAAHTKAVQLNLGYLPENLPIYPDLSVADYLDFSARLKGMAGRAGRAEIRRAVEATDIGSVFLSPIATLSRGFKQRVGVAQAILGRPGLLILDEPTNGLDPTQTEHMRELIRDLASSATVILSTHIMQEVDALCDRVLILSAGRLAVDSGLAELRSGDRAVLSTSLPAAALAPLLETLPGVLAVRADSAAANAPLRLELAPDGQRETCARVVRAVLEAGGELFELRREQRNLETLFAEVSRAPLSNLAPTLPTEETAHAAA